MQASETGSWCHPDAIRMQQVIIYIGNTIGTTALEQRVEIAWDMQITYFLLQNLTLRLIFGMTLHLRGWL